MTMWTRFSRSMSIATLLIATTFAYADSDAAASRASASARVSVTVPAISGVTIAFPTNARDRVATSGSPVTISTFTSGGKLFVQRYARERQPLVVRASNKETMDGIQMGSGWSSVRDVVDRVPRRTSDNGSTSPDVIYEVWTF